MMAPGSGRQGPGYQQATSGPMLVLQAAQERMAGEPIGEDEERRFRALKRLRARRLFRTRLDERIEKESNGG